MSRSNTHLDGMLRHLGAAYYDSLQGKATQADVNRAVDNVAAQLAVHTRGDDPPYPPNMQALPAVTDAADVAGQAVHEGVVPRGFHGWSRRVSDVMAASVVTVDRATPYKEIARLLAEHRISGMPVLKMGREVVGVVTEADLLAAEASTARRLHASASRNWWPRSQRHPALTAGELMTSPAITVG